MRRALLAVALLATALAPASAPAAKPLYGTVDHAWLTTAQHGRALHGATTAAPRVIANFVWLRPPTPGQELKITWVDPSGAVIAVWKDRTLRSDRAGTRLWASIPNGLFASRTGSWHAKLRVGGVLRSTLAFVVR